MNTTHQNDSLESARAILEIDVLNHAGVMSHVVGLFSRRAYNVEGILCMQVGNSCYSRIWLLLNEDESLPKMIKQVEKLEDVTNVRRHSSRHAVFRNMTEFFQQQFLG